MHAHPQSHRSTWYVGFQPAVRRKVHALSGSHWLRHTSFRLSSPFRPLYRQHLSQTPNGQSTDGYAYGPPQQYFPVRCVPTVSLTRSLNKYNIEPYKHREKKGVSVPPVSGRLHNKVRTNRHGLLRSWNHKPSKHQGPLPEAICRNRVQGIRANPYEARPSDRHKYQSVLFPRRCIQILRWIHCHEQLCYKHR